MGDYKKEKIASIKDEVRELHPLLKVLLPKLPSVVEVEYTHGITEFGADFVFSKEHAIFGHHEYVAVIAKVGKINQDLSDVERQIEECLLFTRPFSSARQQIRIDEVWVVSTDNITSGAQRKIFEKYKSTKIVFISGEKLTSLVDKHFPTYWTNTTLQVGEYLSSVRTSNQQRDRQLSLIPVGENGFYIEQDLCEFPRYESRKLLRIKNKKPRQVNIFEEVKEHRFILIEGAGGSGKSKLLRQLIDYYALPNTFLDTKILPIITTYKELRDEYDLNFEALIEKKVPEIVRSEIKNEKASFLILVDAFDEKKIETEEQIDEIGKIFDALKGRENMKIILTSRYLSKLDQTNILESEIARFDLVALSMKRTIQFVQTLCTKLNLASRLLEDLKKSQLFREMPRSPIAAILLAKLINENPKDIPSSLSELYSQYLELILGRWEIEKGLETQKEYEALNNILVEYSKYILDYEMPVVSLGDAKGIVRDYLSSRNLNLDADQLFDKLINRCEIVAVDPLTGNIGFKHRSFAEFFYGKHLAKWINGFDFEGKAFTLYWMNTVFFYLGILKDAPELISRLANYKPESEGEKWLKVVNMSNFMLAAYATPYTKISEATTTVLLEASYLFSDITSRKMVSPFAALSQMQFLHFMQYLIRDSYSFDFFKTALEDAVLSIDDSDAPDMVKAYAIYFLNATYIELGATDTFDILLDKYWNVLPFDISLMIHNESKDVATRSALMRKLDRKVKRHLQDNRALQHQLKLLYESPIRALPSGTTQEKQ